MIFEEQPPLVAHSPSSLSEPLLLQSSLRRRALAECTRGLLNFPLNFDNQFSC